MMSLTEWVVSGGLLAILGFTIKLNGDISKARSESQDKVERVYERFDEYKESFENKHVSKDICQVLHKQIKDDVAEIKADVKTLIRKSNGG